jgi:hypothetical protein
VSREPLGAHRQRQPPSLTRQQQIPRLCATIFRITLWLLLRLVRRWIFPYLEVGDVRLVQDSVFAASIEQRCDDLMACVAL